jgi:hypothetical protein
MVRSGAPHVCAKERVSTKWKHDPSVAIGRGCNVTREGKKVLFGVSASGTKRHVEPVKHRGSLWWYGPVGHGHDASADTGHPATFAQAFAIDAVNVWSNPNDLVCDPFTGSGTVAVACRGLGRHFVGAERVPKYHEIALRRLDPTHINQESAAESVGPLFERQP